MFFYEKFKIGFMKNKSKSIAIISIIGISFFMSVVFLLTKYNEEQSNNIKVIDNDSVMVNMDAAKDSNSSHIPCDMDTTINENSYKK